MKGVEKVERCRKEKEATKVKYNEALQELNRANPKYMDDMNEVSIEIFLINHQTFSVIYPGLLPVSNV